MGMHGVRHLRAMVRQAANDTLYNLLIINHLYLCHFQWGYLKTQIWVTHHDILFVMTH